MQRKILKTIVLFTLTLMAAFISPKDAYAQSLEDVLEVIDLYYNSYSSSVVTIPDDLYQEYALDLGENASYEIVSGSSASISEEGVISPKITYTYVIGGNGEGSYRPTYTEGTTIIDISDGIDTKQITVNVMNYARKYSGDLMDQVAEQIMNEYDSDYERLEAATKYTAQNYSYGVSASSCIGMIMLGAGDCWASTGMILELCDRMEIKSYARNANNDPGAGSGHYNVVALCDGIVYIADAGYSGTKPRYYNIEAEEGGFSKTGSTTVYQYDGFDENVVIPEGVTTIGNDNRCVFSYSYTDVKSVYIPSTVSEITRFAFGYANSLTRIEVSEDNPYFTSVDGVLYTKDMKTLVAYPGGKTVTSFTLPNTVTTLGKTCFYYVNCVDEIVLPDHLEVIEEGALFQSSINSIEIPATVTRIDENALTGVKYIYAHGMKGNLADSFIGTTSVIYGLEDSSYIQYAMNHEMLYEIYTEEELSLESIDISSAEISGIENSYPATSNGVRPIPVVKVNGRELRQNTEFTVSYSNTGSEGDATLTIQGVGKYTGSTSVFYVITKIKVSDPVITYEDNSAPEQSEIQTWLNDNVTIEYEGKELIYDTDYSYYYDNSDSNGNVLSIVIRYIGAYSGYSYLYNFAFATCEDIDSQDYTGKPIMPDVTVEYSYRTLEENEDYTVSYSNNTEVGTAMMILTGTGNYFGSLEKEFEIIKKTDISDATVGGVEEEYPYVFSRITPEPVVTLDGKILTLNEDYTLSYSDNIEIGSNAKIVITGIGDYKGSIEKTFVIYESEETKPVITYSSTDIPNDDNIYEWLENNVEIEIAGKQLIYGTDYRCYGFSTNSNSDIASIYLAFIGSYSGYYNLYNIQTVYFDDIEYMAYTGNEITPETELKKMNDILEKGVDYKIAYANNVNKGIATITYTGIGCYYGSITDDFMIVDENEIPRTAHYVRGVGGIVSYYEENFANWLCSYLDEDGDECFALLYDGTKIYSVDLGCFVVWSENKCAFVMESDYVDLGQNNNDNTVNDTNQKETNINETTEKYISNEIIKELAQTTALNSKLDKVKIAKAVKKSKSSKKIKLCLKKKISGAKGYQIKIYKTKKLAKANKKAVSTKTTTKITTTISSSKFRGTKSLYVRVRAYQTVNGKKVYGKWSTVKKITTK